MTSTGSFGNTYESVDRVHFPAGIRGTALIGTTAALSFLRFVVFFTSISSGEESGTRDITLSNAAQEADE
jgi:hypothetical protein